jgi:hypothetical protein
MWRTLRQFFGEHLPGIASSLQRGVSNDEWRFFLHRIVAIIAPEGPLPGLALLRLLFDVHNGQNASTSKWNGMLGGYSVYDHTAVVKLLPTETIVHLAQQFRHQIGIFDETWSKLVPIAINTIKADKVLRCVLHSPSAHFAR